MKFCFMKKLNTKEDENDFTDLIFNYGGAAEKRIKSTMTKKEQNDFVA